MDLLLRLLERRTIIALAVALAAILFAHNYGSYWIDRADMMRHPPASAAAPLAVDILKDAETREAAKFRGLHRAVSAEISAARAQGFKIEELQTLADDILAMDKPEYRAVAIERLNKLRVAIPQKKNFKRTANTDDQNPDLFDPLPPKSSKRHR